ncbi:MAG: EAL domain-containing protein [Magnetococcales bacterium]|nr:EAL domain-containing protein [Magnetococcales bacterium]
MDHKGLLLVVEDDVHLSNTMKHYLEFLQYQVLVAHDANVGMELFSQHLPELVLTDLRLPGMDGLELLARIRTLSSATPVILISGHGDKEDVIKALRLGAWNYLNKPLESLHVLGHAVEQALDHARLVRDHRLAMEQKMEQLALYDPLTGLPNRIFFQDRLTHEIAIAKRNKSRIALLFIDLDRFKWINDTLGHAAGDELLKEASRRLRGCIRDSDTIARLGGDEFTILLDNVVNPEKAASVAQKLIGALSEPIALSGLNVHVGASVGIAIFPRDAKDTENLLKHADMAMYQAKESGRNTFRFASNELHVRAFQRIALEHDLHQALEQDGLIAYYQPKLHIPDNRLCGMEALVRWKKADGTIMNPVQFIPLAEETGLIVPIGRKMLLTAARCAATLANGRNLSCKMAVNLSSREFQQPDLLAQIRAILQETGLQPECLELEITESMVMDHVEKAIQLMKDLRDLGISLAMDDFGTGYSSLLYLKSFPLNTLKIDRSFVQDLRTEDEENGMIVNAILSMAHGLKLDVVAEGVETQEQLECLRRWGCEMAQGYFIGKPMPYDALLTLYSA